MRTALRGLPLLAALASVALTLAACDPTNILALLTTEVKKATGKMLAVSSVTPAHTSTDVKPGIRMTVIFDREIDMGTVSESTVTISPVPQEPPASPDFHLKFSSVGDTRTLYIDPDPWLGDTKDYTLTVTRGVKGADGSEMENDYSWSFRTGIYPKGNVKIENDKAAINTTTGQPLNLAITCSDLGYGYRLGSTEAECLASVAWYNAGGTAFTDNTHVVAAAADGTQSVYIQFKVIGETNPDKWSAVSADGITLDRVLPTVTPSTQTVYLNASNYLTGVVPTVSATDDRSGVDSTGWQWTPNASTTFSSTTVQAPTITVPAGDGGPYSVTVRAKDKAGNLSNPASTVTVYRDTVAPNAAPTLTPPASPAFAQMPTWTWSPNSTEPTHTYRLEVAGSNGYSYTSSSTTATTFYRKTIWPDYSKGLQPGTYTVNLWERDAAGNLAGPATATSEVTSVLPINGATYVSTTPTLQWWIMSFKGTLPRYYYLHVGTLSGGVFTEEYGARLVPPASGDPSHTVTTPLRMNTTYYWYVDDREQYGLRTPADTRAYWRFRTILIIKF